jgi:peptidoglycan hydrolase CwlO-like protein
LIETEKQISNCEGNIRNLTTSVDNITTRIRSNNLEINLAFNSVDDANLRLTTVNSSLSIVKSKI